jgi:hypothetical protein
MIRNFIVLIVLFFSTISYSQDRLGGFSNSLKTSDTFIRGAVPIVNSQNGDISFFLFDSTRIYGYLFNDNFEKIDEIKSDNRRRKYKSLIGSSISNDNVYKLFMSNENHTKFGYIDFSYSKKESKFKELDLKIDNEKYLETFVYDNKFFLMTITKKSSILNLYSFNNEGDYKKEIIDFSKEIFLNQSRKKVLLYNMFLDSKINLYFTPPTKIEENNPNPIEVTSARRKLYLRGDQLVFTFDNNKEYTQIISLNLKTRDYNLRQIEKPYIPKGTRKQANSYLNGDHFYTMVSTSEKFIFRAYEFKSGELKKEYLTTVNDTISFKNSPIIQEGGIYDSYREMEKTRKYLRKITAGDLGISVYNINGNNQIILGGKKEIQTNSGMMMGGFGMMPIGSIGALSFSINPTFFAYNSYVNTKSTYIECLFDENFNHLQGEFQKNVFDKITDYKDTNEIAPGVDVDKAETVFRYKDYYIFGFYNARTKRYKFRKFTDN